jgi:hypothetical protein
MHKIVGAMKLKMKQIVLLERRPFSFADFREFEIGGEKYEMRHGTFRNNISRLMKEGEVELAFKSRSAFYTIPGNKFSKAMTLDHMGVPPAIIDPSVLKQTPIYKWIKTRPFNKQALHNIRLTFKSIGIWDIFSKVYEDLIEYNSQDIKLQPLTFFNYIDVTITIHHTDTVSVAVACSSRPIVIDANDILQLFEALTRTETYLGNIIDSNCRSNNKCSSTVTISCYRKWIVKMWHFGVGDLMRPSICC